MIGGDVQGTERTLGSIEKYNEKNEIWDMITYFPIKREGCAICAVNSSIYLFGGWDLRQTYNNWDAYNVDSGRWLSQDDIDFSQLSSLSGTNVLLDIDVLSDGNTKNTTYVGSPDNRRLIYPVFVQRPVNDSTNMLIGARAVATSSC